MGTNDHVFRSRALGIGPWRDWFLMSEKRDRITPAELEAECGTQLPDKEVVSLLDLFVNIDLALDLAAPIDLAVAANANVAAPIEGAVSANLLSFGSESQALSTQVTQITQGITGDSVATAPQSATIDQSNDVVDDGTSGADAITAQDEVVGVSEETLGDTTGTVGETTDTVGDTVDDTTGVVTDISEGGLLDDGLLNVNVDVVLDADMAAPIAGAVAAQANVAAPIDASVATNIASFDSTATAVAQQSSVITQTIEGNATATADQTAEITQ